MNHNHTHEAGADVLASSMRAGNVSEQHFPEPRPCGSDLCDQDHDGPCWICGEPWPCISEREQS